MIIKMNDKKYKIHICDNMDNIKYMINYIELYILKNTIRYTGIDFEFNRVNNKRSIALCQLNLEIKNDINPYIFIFYPPDIEKHSDVFKRLLLSDNTIKILHGGESLDIPYLFTDVLLTKEERYKFGINLYDTRFMCEYYNISNDLINNKCKIYELLLQMKVINKNTYTMLEENDKKMGNIWEINLEIDKLNESVILYTLYDVLFLPALFEKFPKSDIYMKLLPGINNYNNINRFDNTLNTLHLNISKYNTSFYKNISMNDIYIAVYMWLVCTPEYNNLFQINYYKKFYEVIIKHYIYSKLLNNYNTTNIFIINNDMILNHKTMKIFLSNLYKSIDEML